MAPALALINLSLRRTANSKGASIMAFVQFPQPDAQPVVVNTERIVTAAPMSPDGVGTRITFTNRGHQDVKEPINDVLRR